MLQRSAVQSQQTTDNISSTEFSLIGPVRYLCLTIPYRNERLVLIVYNVHKYVSINHLLNYITLTFQLAIPGRSAVLVMAANVLKLLCPFYFFT